MDRLFFPAGPPPFAHPPSDPILALRITKLAEFAARNGPGFVDEVRSKQHHNPEYAFLFGGEGAPFFAWTLYTQLSAPPATPAAAAPLLPPPPLPEEVRSGWNQVLNLLNGTRESITTSQAWFMACAPHAEGMAAMTAAAAEAATEHARTPYLLWLASDILFAAKSQRPEGAFSDAIAAAWRPHLGRLLRACYSAAGGDAERQQAVVKVVKLWAERGVYPGPEVEAMTMAMMGLPPPPPSLPLPPPPPGHAAAPWQPPPPGPAHHYPAPGHFVPPPPQQQQQPLLPPAAPLPPPPEPPQEPQEPEFDPFSFPPGLIPGLVDENLKSEPPYAPLKAEEIIRSGVPPPPSTDDPYLNAQLDKFYAQLADYRPGSTFADLEMDPPRPRAVADAWVPSARPIDDGSGGFGPVSGRAGGRGLGYGTSAGGEGQDDVFSSYRAMRSQGYHAGVLRSSR